MEVIFPNKKETKEEGGGKGRDEVIDRPALALSNWMRHKRGGVKPLRECHVLVSGPNQCEGHPRPIRRRRQRVKKR